MADINILTATLRKEFISNMQAVGEPAPVDAFTTDVPSTARIENYAWMTPAPGLARYKGYRRLGQISPINYKVENLEYDATLSVNLRDYEDDQIGGYKMRMKDLVEKSKAPFKSREVLRFAAAGQTNTCFDGTAFYAAAHNLGGYAATSPFSKVTYTGGNVLAYNCTASDANTHAFAVFVHSTALKPLIYQTRKKPLFNTDAGTPASSKAKRADYWVDLEAAVAHGYWWDSVLVKITDTPTVLELIEAIDAARQALRQFSLPVSLATDPLEYPHDQLQFSPKNVTIVCSVGIETLMDRVLNESYYGISSGSISPNNLYYKKFNMVTSNYFNGIT